MITSTSNKRIKNVIALLGKSRERKKQNCFIVEGIKMFVEAPGDWIKEVYISEELEIDAPGNEAVAEKLAQLKVQTKDTGSDKNPEQTDIIIETVKTDVFNKMCDTKTPQGILSVLQMPSYSLKDLQGSEKGLYLVLEDIQDPGNLGTMMRTGEGAGVSGVIMSSHTVDIFNPKTIRATMGSIYRVPFVYVDDLAKAVRDMNANGIKIYAAHLKGQNAYDKENYQKATAFLIGNEGNGLSREIADLADCYIKIPMLGQVESLNAAIAASLLIYEAARQRRN